MHDQSIIDVQSIFFFDLFSNWKILNIKSYFEVLNSDKSAYLHI